MSKIKNENELELYDFFKHKKKFAKQWHTKKIKGNATLTDALSTSSKSEKGNRGEPDLSTKKTTTQKYFNAIVFFFLFIVQNRTAYKFRHTLVT